MITSRKLWYSILLLVLALPVLAQEELYDLRYNPALQQRAMEQTDNTASRDIERRPFIYLIDTMQLPFIDDFSTDLVKKYHAKETDDNIVLHVNYKFTVNGEHPETLEFMHEPTYSRIKQGNDTTHVQNPPLYITYYDDGDPVAYDTGWTNIIKETDLNQGIISYDTLEAETLLVNVFDTLYLVLDGKTQWVTPADEEGRGGAYINNTFGINMLTQGVATFDGTDAFGMPYDITTATTYGSADTLESKPIYLDENMDNIYLSFAYQAGGHGNDPDEEDSLILEFYNIDSEEWDLAWSTPGAIESTDTWSDQVILPIKNAGYRKPGFRFRFRNFATLSGMLDHWHIDYVHLDEDRDSASIDTLVDVAFVTPISSFTAPYTSVPYSHYLGAATELEAASVNTQIHNLGYNDVFVSGLNYSIFDPDGSLVSSFITTAPNLPAETLGNFVFNLTEDSIFPDLGQESAEFEIESFYSVSGNNDLFINDTIRSKQVFRNHYSYDDGSAEKAYALTGSGLQLAYEFTTPFADTLKAILINFPIALHDNAEDMQIELRVWDESKSDPIYVSPFVTSPAYSVNNEFFRYELETPIVVNGKFFIGFRQLQPDKIYIGFDANNIATDKISYKINETWYNSTFSGALMMRADFGEAPDMVSVEEQPTVIEADFSLYPNPASGDVYVRCGFNPVDVQVFSLDGALVSETNAYHGDRIDLHHVPSGIYLVRMTDRYAGQTSVSKLIIAR